MINGALNKIMRKCSKLGLKLFLSFPNRKNITVKYKSINTFNILLDNFYFV